MQSNHPLKNKKSLLMMALLLGSATANNIRWSDPYCNTFSADGTCCLKCSYRYVMDAHGRCQPVSDQCRTWDAQTGACTSCYQGYINVNGCCVIGGGNNGNHGNGGNVGGGQEDDNCAQYGYIDVHKKWYAKYQNGCKKVCKACDEGFYLTGDYKCLQLPANCQAADQNGNCTDCADGYYEANGVCNPIVSLPPDDNCAEYGYIDFHKKWYKKYEKGCKKVCKVCDQGFYLNANYECLQLPANCNAADQNGNCTECADGYKVADGVCYPIVSTPPEDNCARYGYVDANNNHFAKYFKGCKQVCVECDAGFYLDANNQCQVLTGNCLAADVNGNCTQCQEGYCVKNGQCVLIVNERDSKPSKVSKRSERKSRKSSRGRSNSYRKKWGHWGVGNWFGNSKKSERDTQRRTQHFSRDTNGNFVGQRRFEGYTNFHNLVGQGNSQNHTERDTNRHEVGSRFGNYNENHNVGKWARVGERGSWHDKDSKKSKHEDCESKLESHHSRKEKDTECTKKWSHQKDSKKSKKTERSTSRKQVKSRQNSHKKDDCDQKKSKRTERSTSRKQVKSRQHSHRKDDCDSKKSKRTERSTSRKQVKSRQHSHKKDDCDSKKSKRTERSTSRKQVKSRQKSHKKDDCESKESKRTERSTSRKQVKSSHKKDWDSKKSHKKDCESKRSQKKSKQTCSKKHQKIEDCSHHRVQSRKSRHY